MDKIKNSDHSQLRRGALGGAFAHLARARNCSKCARASSEFTTTQRSKPARKDFSVIRARAPSKNPPQLLLSTVPTTAERTGARTRRLNSKKKPAGRVSTCSSQFHRLVSREKFVKTLCAVFQKKTPPKFNFTYFIFMIILWCF